MTPLTLGLALLLTAPGVKDPPKKDPPSLVGKWVAESAVKAGKPDHLPPGATIEFTADGKCLFTENAGAKPEEGSYKADPKKDPAEIDIAEPGGADHPARGIYKIDGDTMTLALVEGRDKDRPTKFESPAGSPVMLITLKRVKKE